MTNGLETVMDVDVSQGDRTGKEYRAWWVEEYWVWSAVRIGRGGASGW
jgi:hypothetical protein